MLGVTSAPTSTRVAELLGYTRLQEAFSRAITPIPLFTSIFLINLTEPDYGSTANTGVDWLHLR